MVVDGWLWTNIWLYGQSQQSSFSKMRKGESPFSKEVMTGVNFHTYTVNHHIKTSFVGWHPRRIY